MSRTIRRLTLEEIQTLLDWAAAEGWNPGLNDAVPFQSADPNGFLGAFVDETMVAGISAVAYGADFGFIGLYICHPDWRGQGHGKAVWDAAMAYLGDRTIGLDGVPEQQANYARMGFQPVYETVRMSGTLAGSPVDIQSLSSARVEDVSALDTRCFPAAREAFLSQWLAAPRRSLTHQTDGLTDGYAVCRPCRTGAKIGPLFATSVTAGMALLSVQSGPIQIDVPVSQTEWLAELSRFGFTDSFVTRRMYRGRPPVVDMPAILGISTLELG